MTDAELTILSLIAENSLQGHEIQRLIDERGLRDWLTIGFASVFYLLNKLEQQKMIASHLSIDRRGPARKTYTITEAGIGVLQTAIADRLRETRPLGSGFELGLVNIGALKPSHVQQVLSHRQQDLRLQLNNLKQTWEQQQADNPDDVVNFESALYTRSIALIEAEIAWLETFLAKWADAHPQEDTTEDEVDPHRAKTMISHRTPPRAKQVQKLKRPRPPKAE